jgi:tetratricopeptide (TPR) repeat protein
MIKKPLTLGAKIKSLRLSKGLTQGELTRGEITAGLISQIESDRVAPSLRVITLLAEQLGVTPHELLDEVETRNLQMQALKEAKELLTQMNGEAALPLLLQLLEASVSYISIVELKLDIAYAKEIIGDIETAISYYADVEQYTFTHEDHWLGAQCMNHQGELYFRLGRIPLALHCFKKALNFLTELSSPPIQQICNTRKNISICAYRLGNTEQAQEQAELAYHELQGTSYISEMAELCHILSVLYVSQDNKDKAQQFALDSVSIYRSLGMEAQLTDAKMNYAIVLKESGDINNALSVLPSVISEYYHQNRNLELSNAWAERASCEIMLTQYDNAERSLERSFSLAEPDSLEYAESLRIRGILEAEREQTEKAIESLESALSLLLKMQKYMTSEQVLRRLKTLYTTIGDQIHSFESHERICTLVARIRHQKMTTFITP